MTNENKDKMYNRVSATISQGNFPHAVMIECDNQDDGENFARFMANCLVCQSDKKPCGECGACRKYKNNGHPDVLETDGITGKSKFFTVDAVREIRNNAFIIPNESDKKIYILKNANNMNEQAQNALLKILEEPPTYVYFILVTTSKSAMLQTILSRVSVYSLMSGEEEISEKEAEAVSEFVRALLSVNEMKLLEVNSRFRKNSQFARDVLELLSQVFRDALIRKNGFVRDFRFADEIGLLCSSLTAKSLLDAQKVCDELIESVDRNCNNNLLITRMCYEFKRAVGR